VQPDDPVVTESVADGRFSEWMNLNLERAAQHFGLTVTGQPVVGWRLRTIGARANGPGGPRWLRVVTEFPDWAQGDTWTGNSDANSLVGIPKPRVLEVLEWQEADWRNQRAEVMTLLPGRGVSTTDVLRNPIILDDLWWVQLKTSIEALRVVSTERIQSDQEFVSRRTREVFGFDLEILEWETVHGDLHWGNILSPQLGIVDWELWGQGPACTDAATLMLYSLRTPVVAARVQREFCNMLETPSGTIAQIAVAARLYSRMTRGEYLDLVKPLDQHMKSMGITPITTLR
jgi:hypothetical protein